MMMKVEVRAALCFRLFDVCRLLLWAAWHVEMKIDEKVVTYFESCNSPVDKEGFLYKKVRAEKHSA